MTVAVRFCIDERFVKFLTFTNLAFNKLNVAKVGLVNSFYDFLNINIISLAKCFNLCLFLGVGMPQGCVGAFHKKEVGIWPLAGLVPSSQTVGFLL
jgi:hypothetical protein